MLAKLAGAEVGDDPEDSDFGKIIIGNTRIDIWGGIQQPMRLLMTGAIQILDKTPYVESTKNIDVMDALHRFVSKSYPNSQIAISGLPSDQRYQDRSDHDSN